MTPVVKWIRSRYLIWQKPINLNHFPMATPLSALAKALTGFILICLIKTAPNNAGYWSCNTPCSTMLMFICVTQTTILSILPRAICSRFRHAPYVTVNRISGLICHKKPRLNCWSARPAKVPFKHPWRFTRQARLPKWSAMRNLVSVFTMESCLHFFATT